MDVSPLKVKEIRDEGVLLVDVREHHEVQIAKIPGKQVVFPTSALSALEITKDLELEDLVPPEMNDKNTKMIVLCKRGRRSRAVVDLLTKAGWKNVRNVEGGIEKYAQLVDSSIPNY